MAIAAARLKRLDELEYGMSSLDIDSIESKVIILLTDGENNSGSHLPLEAAGLAKAWDCRVYVVSLGESMNLDNDNQSSSDLSTAEEVLQRIAEETGGIFRKATDFESLQQVYQEIDALEPSEITTKSFERQADWFWLPALLAMIAMVSAIILQTTWLRVIP